MVLHDLGIRQVISPGNTDMRAITWPEGYIPGEADNFASNEVIVKGLSAAELLPELCAHPLP